MQAVGETESYSDTDLWLMTHDSLWFITYNCITYNCTITLATTYKLKIKTIWFIAPWMTMIIWWMVNNLVW